MDSEQIRSAVALGELLDLGKRLGINIQVNEQGIVTMADGSMAAAGVEEALSMLRSMIRRHSHGLRSDTIPEGLCH
jgi:hypothetical protein